jgi:preprotein translocase subunit SecE
VKPNKITSFGGVKLKFLRDVSREMRKVSWPKSNELVSYTITVIATVAFVAVFFTIVDLLISQVLNRL